MTDSTTKTIHPGSKFFTFIEGQDEPEIRRVYDVDPMNDKVKYFNKNGKRCSMSYTELISDYRMLKADGVITFSIVDVNGTPDVIVALKKIPIVNNLPDVICRQSIMDFFTNNMQENYGKTFVGVSVSQDTCPANIEFEQILSCTGLAFSRAVMVYMDDTLDDILKQINLKKYNTALQVLQQKAPATIEGKLVTGYNNTVRDLLVNNNFMYDFRRIYGIIQTPFAIDEEADALTPENVLFLENELKVNIMETYVIRYTKEIDLKTIKRDYVLLASKMDDYSKVYIVGYDKSDNEYVSRV